MSSFAWLLCLAAIGSSGWLLAADGAWISLASMPDPRQEVGAAELNGKIYVVGGLPRTNTVQEFTPATNTWRIVSPLPIAVDHTAAASLGGKLYVLGGDTSSGPTNAVYEYDPTANQWTQKASMPTARAALAAVVIAGKIYAVGGTSSSQRELEVYDPITNIWTVQPLMPTGRNHLAAGAIKGKLYVTGGRPGNLNTLEVFDPASATWTSKTPMPTGRSGHAAAVVRDKLYTFGGEGNLNSPIGIFRETEAYDPETDTWKTLDPMITPRHGIGAAVIGNRIYIPAGATQAGGGTHTGINEAFVVQPEKLFLAHFASGPGISTETIVSNLSENENALATVELFDQAGLPLKADLGGIVREKAVSEILPLGTVTLRSSDSTSPTRVGFVLVSADMPISGTVLFSSTIAGFRGTAGVGNGQPLTRFSVPMQRDPFKQIFSGIAIANTTDAPVTVNLALRNQGGAILANRVINLPARGQVASFLEQVFPNADIITFTFNGTVTGTSTGAIAALALLFTGTDFATLPVTSY